MAIYNFGSINVDHLYQVDHFVRPGETMASASYQCFLGGKGANQSVALAKAHADVKHVGAVHMNDHAVLQQLADLGVNTNLIARLEVPMGHAIIQLKKDAENAIILFQGANHALTEKQVDQVCNLASQGDWVLLQNETNQIEYIIKQANAHGLKVAFNPAPMNAVLAKKVLKLVDLLILNEVEAMDLLGAHNIDMATELLPKTYPDLSVLMMLGKAGVRYSSKRDETGKTDSIFANAFAVDAVDTTAAGDTFIGYYLASLMANENAVDAMTRACAASALCVTRIGATSAIPTADEVTEFLAKQA